MVKLSEKDEVIIYKTKKGPRLKVKLETETVWLNLGQMALLFNRDKSVISRHIKNIFLEKELIKKSVVAKFATTASDGKTYNVDYYNLDIIISVGYRVKSQKGVSFRIWATKTLKEHLIKGYTLNRKRLLQQTQRFKELQKTIAFLETKSKISLLKSQGQELLSLLSEYSKTLSILEQYDKNRLILPKVKKPTHVINYQECQDIIKRIKAELIKKKEAGSLFGQEGNFKFKTIIENIYQTFGDKPLYKSIEEKASHLLYLTIKDHPFSDGNKRLGSFLFIYFLDKNNYLRKPTGERKINDNALTALALLVAESLPKEKEIMIKIITRLLAC